MTAATATTVATTISAAIATAATATTTKIAATAPLFSFLRWSFHLDNDVFRFYSLLALLRLKFDLVTLV